uniref:Uncharacterized protein n=1 Tax=Pithovirus LCPAC406 TaxID=2506599 RepID=A0A481ZD24_9VIRU|nr:MAG: hypothetical protein LCPAC406_01280 [Pithovirus LCPAC406]
MHLKLRTLDKFKSLRLKSKNFMLLCKWVTRSEISAAGITTNVVIRVTISVARRKNVMIKTSTARSMTNAVLRRNITGNVIVSTATSISSKWDLLEYARRIAYLQLERMKIYS